MPARYYVSHPNLRPGRSRCGWYYPLGYYFLLLYRYAFLRFFTFFLVGNRCINSRFSPAQQEQEEFAVSARYSDESIGSVTPRVEENLGITRGSRDTFRESSAPKRYIMTPSFVHSQKCLLTFTPRQCRFDLSKNALDLLLPKLATVIHRLSQFALEYKDMPTLGYSSPPSFLHNVRNENF